MWLSVRWRLPWRIPHSSLYSLLVLLIVIIGRNHAQRQQESGGQQCSASGSPCPGSSSLKHIVYGKLLQRIESVQLDLSIIESEMGCDSYNKLLNQTREVISTLRSVDFDSLLGDCLVSGAGMERQCCSTGAPCDCSTLLKSCLGPGPVRFYTAGWRELLDNIRTSVRILLSQHPCTLPTSTLLLSKLHSGRELGHFMQCQQQSKSCSPLNQVQVVARQPPPLIYNRLLQLSAGLREHWPTTTVNGGQQSLPIKDTRRQDDDFEGSGHHHDDSGGQNDQNYSGDGLHDLITDDEDLLQQSEFGSGDYSTSTERTTTTSRPPTGRKDPVQTATATANRVIKADLTVLITLIVLRLMGNL